MDLLEQGLRESTYKKLVEANLDSPKLILSLDKLELQRKTQLTNKEIQEVIQIIANGFIHNKIKTALEMPDCIRVKIGCSEIDQVLNGGLAVNGINEIMGASGVGKSQIALQLALHVQLNANMGGLGKGAVYISTEDVFPIKRLHQLAKAFPISYQLADGVRLEDNVYIEHIVDYEQLRRCLCVRLPNLLRNIPIGVIIIDSIAGVFRHENEATDYTNRSLQLYSIANQLKKLSDQFNLLVLCINQIMDNINTGVAEPALGLAWSNLVTSRFKISRLTEHQSTRKFEVIYAPDLPNKHCLFSITSSGLANL